MRLAPRDSEFGGQVSRWQVAEVIAAAVANPSLAENKVGPAALLVLCLAACFTSTCSRAMQIASESVPLLLQCTMLLTGPSCT